MIFSKSARRFTLGGAASAIAVGLMAASVAPAGAADVKPGELTDAQVLNVVKTVNGAGGPERDSYIIGGSKTSIKSYPFMAQLFVKDSAGRWSFCGGSVVNSKKILTAAHCVHGRNYVTNGFVVLGATHIADGNGLHGGKVFYLKKQWKHPKYNARTIANDVAVLTLKTATRAKPIKVTTSTDKASYKAGTKATILGWGRTSSTKPDLAANLKKATLPINSDATCKAAWGATFIPGANVCAGKKSTGSDRTTTTSCNGDSGGPLIVKGRIVGVVSWGIKDCVKRGFFPVYAKYSTYAKTVAPQLRN
ncbi:serine protease [Streptomyces sp. NPDC097619]|uniref:S1 family peptidase n=1 Tax=Streptomyces sp. NPDC097619 TaxID=3157228 RepID=UPI00332F09C7